MSIHSSLRGVNTLVGQRSVLSRVERIQKLAKDGKFDLEKGSPYGLPKVRTKFKVAGAKKKKAETPAAGAPAAGVTPAAPTSPAAPAKAPGKGSGKG
jgi:small basic protein (TIGR04137 family)